MANVKKKPFQVKYQGAHLLPVGWMESSEDIPYLPIFRKPVEGSKIR